MGEVALAFQNATRAFENSTLVGITQSRRPNNTVLEESDGQKKIR